MNYDSVAPLSWKIGLVKCFVHRAYKICSDETLLSKEVEMLRDIFYKNGYPRHFFDKISAEYINKKKKQNLVQHNTEVQDQQQSHSQSDQVDKENGQEPFRPMIKIPFIGKSSTLFSRKLRRLVKSECELDVRVVYQTKKVKDYFVLKDDIPKAIKSKVVYKFTCSSDSSVSYIGYTKRNLLERVKEHLGGNTAISDHISVCSSCNTNGVTIKNFEILKTCRTEYDTKVYEATFIKRNDPVLNRQLVKPRKGFTLAVFT
jgi:hypothetical protein